MIRPTTPGDTEPLVELTAATGVFRSHEIDTLREVLDDYHRANHRYGHRSVTCERAGEVIGFAYYAPDSMADRTWFLYWIAVAPRCQGQGIGAELLRHTEADLAARHARLLLIETSSTPAYEATRRFYQKHGYAVCSVIPDYYCDGDDRVTFVQRLSPEKTAASPCPAG